MRKLLLTMLLSYCASSFAHFSNMIVFGDSLSDGGNFPESQKIWWNNKDGKTLLNAVPQLYVPFSNPVDTTTAPPVFVTAWPTIHNRFLPAQPVMENNPQPRKYRSLSWPQFFLMAENKAHLTTSSIIAPSNLLHTRTIPSVFSFNYAWGYAMATQHCVNPLYQPIAHCDAGSIYQARKNFEENQSSENYHKIEIPGIFKQIELFILDERANKVTVDQHTLYVFWIGANDLIVASKAARHFNPFPALGFMLGLSSENILKSVSLLRHSLPKDKRPQTVYVFNLFNPEFTPAFFHHKVIGALGNFAVHCHNFWLKINTMLFNLVSPTKVIIVPAYEWYNSNSQNPALKNHMGQACQIDGGNYENATVIPKTNCAGFMFWNAVHPAVSMNAFEAAAFAKSITHSKQAMNMRG